MTGATGAATRGTEDILEIRARGAKCGGESEQDAREKRDSESKEQNARIYRDLGSARKVGGQGDYDGFGGEERGRKSEDAAEASEEKALREELVDEAAAARSKSRSNGELGGASHASGEQQAGYVGAGKKQQESDGGEKDQEQRLDVADDVLLHGNEADADAIALVDLGILGCERVGHRVHVGLSFSESDAGSEARHNMRALIDAAIAK
jgi:hypothetical protein